MSIVEIHGRLGNTALLYVIILAVWALWRYFRRQGVDSNFWGALAIAEILLLVQGAFGAYIYFAGIGYLERQFMHFLYGIVGLIVIPAVFALIRGRDLPCGDEE